MPAMPNKKEEIALPRVWCCDDRHDACEGFLRHRLEELWPVLCYYAKPIER